jgi:hypothetical protein
MGSGLSPPSNSRSRAEEPNLRARPAVRNMHAKLRLGGFLPLWGSILGCRNYLAATVILPDSGDARQTACLCITLSSLTQ